ncbi:MAG TPA: hypothetical protein VG013_00730 [Gemmataceae bacterium]|jgi:hypothetical protein|nr:hypothetical protein [Gemmataceae bacterium]
MNPPYRVIYSELVRNALKDLYARAAQKGLAAHVLSAVQTIDHRLRTDPRLFGEAKYRYRVLKLELRVAIEPPLVVHYTVHDEQALVFVKALQSLPGQGF